MTDWAKKFNLTADLYLLSHSVGRPLKSMPASISTHFFEPWQHSNKEPWQSWLGVIERFQHALAELFNGNAEDFCPQVNLSSALTKLLMSHERFNKKTPVVLMTEADFPSMGFVIQKALGSGVDVRYIPATDDLTDLKSWQPYVTPDIDLVFISHAFSNTGQQAPVKKIIQLARQNQSLSVVDVAQSAGVLDFNVSDLQPDFLIGSSVKWLCSGPGAAYLWVNPAIIEQCHPKDVGWFSHENPLEFDIHNFNYHSGALKFWGGTPSVLPYAIAAHSISELARIGVGNIRTHNLARMAQVQLPLARYWAGPVEPDKRSGTMILNFGDRQTAVVEKLRAANIAFDERVKGLRMSPHIYNSESDMEQLVGVIQSAL